MDLEPSGEVLLISQLLDMSDRRAALPHLDRHVRARHELNAAAMDLVCQRLRAGTAGPVSWVLGAMHRDGQVRQQAVNAILSGALPIPGPPGQTAASPQDASAPATRNWVGCWDFADPESRTGPLAALVPVLMLRTADWVTQVREAARVGLMARLTADPRYLPIALKSIALVGARTHGRFITMRTFEALAAAPQPVRDALTVSPNPAIRRAAIAASRSSFDEDIRRRR
ncbi:hypothetical protein GCM10022255_106030 [Dactylosporangium darangshiense]|uniref:HEAT repeat domain-containing protein n=1 Tax=Dactylosporangium darangshiense TaxID=579108 RepID=A0ABP8DTD2_9ACTN